VVLLSVVDAHICMWYPQQRGALSIEEPGASPCYRKIGPCGNVSAGPPQTSLIGGSVLTIAFQQNLNHYYFDKPGYLDASLARVPNPVEADFEPFGDVIPDFNSMNMITQTNFTITGVVPYIDCHSCVIRVRYVSNNPYEDDHGTIFYQCADVRIKQDTQALQARLPFNPDLNLPTKNGNAKGCCTIPQWSALSYQTGSWRHPTTSTLFYDSVNKLMRVDSFSGDGVTIYDGFFSMFLNFTSGIEYYLNVHTGKCELYGLDAWNDWCYSQQENEAYTSSVSVGGTTVDVWQNSDFNFLVSPPCIPFGLQRANGDFTLYYNLTAGISDPSVFTPPSQCSKSAVKSKAPSHHFQLLQHPRFVL